MPGLWQFQKVVQDNTFFRAEASASTAILSKIFKSEIPSNEPTRFSSIKESVVVCKEDEEQ